jgi:ACT domain-containing protein
MGDDSSSDESGSGMGDWMSPEDGGDKTDSDQDGNAESTTDEDGEEKTEGSNATGADDGWEDDGTEAEAVESKTPVKSAGQYGSHSQDALNSSLNDDRLDKDMDSHEVNSYNLIAPTNEQIEDAIVPYSEIRKSRLANSDFLNMSIKIPGNWDNHYEDKDTLEEFRKFNATSKKFVNSLKMEFEMKKSAYQYTRATVSKTGKLDVNALHSYKYSEDIFNSVTTLADAKSHGMIFLIDMSGSMSSVIGTIYKQAINLSMFCKAVGIPFKVYGFTSNYYGQNRKKE